MKSRKILKVSEIFSSIEGEGVRAGLPTTFIRLFGCKLFCSYCDSRYACEGTDYADLTIDSILEIVGEIGIKSVTVTGGEPLEQENVYDLIEELLRLDYNVNVETNGSIDLLKLVSLEDEHDNLIITMDWKSKSSNMSSFMIPKNLELLRNRDVLKFVVSSDEDLHQMNEILTFNPDIKAIPFVSPIWGKVEPSYLVNYILDSELYRVRIQLQLHKIIWNPDRRGV